MVKKLLVEVVLFFGHMSINWHCEFLIHHCSAPHLNRYCTFKFPLLYIDDFIPFYFSLLCSVPSFVYNLYHEYFCSVQTLYKYIKWLITEYSMLPIFQVDNVCILHRKWILPYHRHVSEQSATEHFVLRQQKQSSIRSEVISDINLKLTFFTFISCT